MANVDPQTISDIQDSINTLVSNDNDTPTEGDDEWITRLNLIWVAIRNWGTSKDILWHELWATYTLVASLSGTTTYAMATLTNYRFAGGYLRLTLSGATSYVPFIKASQARQYIDSGAKAAYITGSQSDGFTLNLTWTPTAGDGTFGANAAFDYYGFPSKPTAGTDKVQMSDANYIVYWVAGQKSLLESQRNKYSVYDAEATESMDNMVIMNDLLPDYQNNQVENTDALNGAIIGE